MKTLTIVVLCTCGLGLAANAHAGDSGFGQRLASAGDALISAVAGALTGDSGNAGNNASNSSNSSSDLGDGVGTDSSAAAPAGDLVTAPPPAHHVHATASANAGNSAGGGGNGGSGVERHSAGKHPHVLGWQSLLPGSIQ